MLSKTQIEYIITLHEQQSFIKAAEICFVTQPTLSMQIKKAEEQLGKALFDRDHSPITLTSFGKQLLPYFRQIIDAYTILSDEIAKMDGSYKAEIKLGIIPTISDYLIPLFYQTWKKELKGVHLEIIELKSEDLIDALEDRKIDIGILAGPVVDSSINTQILYNEEIYVYSPNISSKTITIDSLANQKPWLLAQGNCLRTQMMNFCNLDSNQTDDDWNYSGGSLSILLQMVDQQGGYTLVPENYLTLLNLESNALKRFQNHNPARQIVAIENTRNAKKEYLSLLKRSIQHKMNKKPTKDVNKLNILPWK